MNSACATLSEMSFQIRNHQPFYRGNSPVLVSMCVDEAITISIAWRSVWLSPTSNWRMLIVAKITHQVYLIALSERERERASAISVVQQQMLSDVQQDGDVK